MPKKVKAGQMWAALPFSVDETAFRRIRMLSSAGFFRGTCLRASADFCDFVALTVTMFYNARTDCSNYKNIIFSDDAVPQICLKQAQRAVPAFCATL